MFAPLALLVLLRAVATLAPGTWGWGLDLQRSLPAALGWALWALSAAALIPAVGDALARATAPLGRGLLGSRVWAGAIAAALLAALVLLLPDRTWFLGDFQLRQHAIEQGMFDAVLPQSLPLDAFLHYHLPRWLQAHAGWPTALYARSLGALEAALLAALAVALVRLVPAGEATAAAAPWLTLALALGAPLAVFTGFPKTTADQCVLALALIVTGLRLLRDGRGHLRFGLLLTVALLDHRGALVFLPAAAWVWWRCGARRDGAARIALAALPPLVTLAALLPRLRVIVATYDVPMHLRSGGASGHALDLVNAVLLAAPLLLLLPLAAGLPRRTRRSPEVVYLLLLGLACVPIVLLVRPRQGLFRDWEVLAPAAVVFTALAIWTLGARFATARPPATRLAVATALVAVTPALALLLHAHDVDAGLARARALLAGPPGRDVIERTFLCDFLGERNLALGRWADAAAAYEQEAAVLPTRGTLLSWGIAAANAGDHAAAARAFGAMLRHDPADLAAWAGLGGAAAQAGDGATAAAARARLVAGSADPRVLAELRRLLHDMPRLWPTLADSLEQP